MKRPEEYLRSRSTVLLQLLSVSVALNFGFFAAFLHSAWKEKFTSISIDKPLKNPKIFLKNSDILQMYHALSFNELVLLLQNKEAVEEGYLKRDLALAVLSFREEFDVQRALSWIHLQKRCLFFIDPISQKTCEVVAFAGLQDGDFAAILHFIAVEAWPFTTKGLFNKLFTSQRPYEKTLLEAFYCTEEFRSVLRLMQIDASYVDPTLVVSLLLEGTWETFSSISTRLKRFAFYTEDALVEFLKTYALEEKSRIGAEIFLHFHGEYALKRLSDEQLMALVQLLEETPLATLDAFAKKLLLSQRSDCLRQEAARILYKMEGEKIPVPYDYKEVLAHFFPEKEPVAIEETAPTRKYHTIERGDSLWKISRKYRVSIQSIMECNHLESEKLVVGRELEIPANSR